MDNYILLDNFIAPRSRSSSSLRASRDLSKRSQKRMSMRQLKKLGSFDLRDEIHKFDAFLQMHDIWRGYLVQLLKNTGKNQVVQCLIDVDIHGHIFRFVACKVESLIGVVGIMIRENAETFGIVTKEDRFKVVLKKGFVFIVQADCWNVTLLGDKIASRNLNSSASIDL